MRRSPPQSATPEKAVYYRQPVAAELAAVTAVWGWGLASDNSHNRVRGGAWVVTLITTEWGWG